MKIYLFNDWHNGDILTTRPLIKELLKHDLTIAYGSCKNRHYLVKDLPVQHIISDHDEGSNPPSLANLCPKGFVCINTWCGTYPDIDVKGYHNWRTIVDTFNRQSEIHCLGIKLSKTEVPMIDFESNCKIKVNGRGIYIENGPTRSGHCDYDFPLEKISNLMNDFSLYCTSTPNHKAPNIINCNNKDLIELSHISNQCEAIIGKGSGPFICTLTEANRLKPKAVVGFKSPKFWEYRNNPLQYLKNEEELMNFLINVKNTYVEII